MTGANEDVFYDDEDWRALRLRRGWAAKQVFQAVVVESRELWWVCDMSAKRPSGCE